VEYLKTLPGRWCMAGRPGWTSRPFLLPVAAYLHAAGERRVEREDPIN
jgi:hypothetical protein